MLARHFAVAFLPALLSAQDQRAAWNKKAEWVKDVMQLDSVEKRNAAIEVIRAALTDGKDRTAVLAALLALPAIREVAFDKKAFDAPVRSHLKAGEGAVRRAAWYALAYTLPDPADVPAVAALVRDADQQVRFAAPNLLHLVGNGDLESDVPSKAILELLEATPAAERRQWLSGIWGARYSGDLEAKLLELSRTAPREERYEVIYSAVSTQGNKSPAVVERLIEAAGGDDVQTVTRALWGLARGVVPAAQDRVVEFGLRSYGDRIGEERRKALEIVHAYGTKKHAAAIRTLAAKPAVTPDAQIALAELAARLDKVPDRETAPPSAR